LSNRLFGAAVAVLSILFLAFAVPSIDPNSGYFAVGPKLFPSIASSLTLLLGVLIAMQKNGKTQVSALQEKGNAISLSWAIGITLAFIILLTQFGFVIAAFLTLATFMFVFGERRIKVVLPVAIGTPLMVHLIFLNAFSLELPSGPIDFLLGGW